MLTLGLKQNQIKSLVTNNKMCRYFDSIVYQDRKRLANIFFSEIVSIVNAKKLTFKALKIRPEHISDGLKAVDKGDISTNQLRDIFKLIEREGIKDPMTEILDRFGFRQLDNPDEVVVIVDKLFEENKDFLLTNRDNHKRIFGFLLGKIMQQSGNKVNPQLAAKIVNQRINQLFNKED